MSVSIPLTQGRAALVDEDDAALVAAYRWHATHNHNLWYAATRTGGPGGGPTLLMHRLILGVAGQRCEVDHINGDGLDNRRANLRLVSHSQNIANQHRKRAPRSGFRGVWFHERKKRWYARTKLHGRSVYLGCFGDALSAARAYDAYAREAFGDCAVLNFPTDIPPAAAAGGQQ